MEERRQNDSLSDLHRDEDWFYVGVKAVNPSIGERIVLPIVSEKLCAAISISLL